MAKSDWLRSTRTYEATELPSGVISGFRAHQERYNLGDLLSDARVCVATVSRKLKKGLLGGRPQEVLVVALLTPSWLAWAIEADRAEPTIMSARLQDIVVQDYASTKFAAMVPDAGLQVSGSFTDVVQRGSAFIGLGPEPAALEFKDALLGAVRAAKT
ncbi:MAG TPA: hypothetical protein VFH29_09960 [Anaerolineales bacterium]|nr:hypothetical protein [Anaerolineales bacterium]